MLLILDNAQTSAQVRPLLPPSTNHNAILITTRHDLTVLDGLYQFDLRPFARTSGESLALFTNLLSSARVQTEQEALQQIADLLGHLPLALAIAAGRLRRLDTDTYLTQLQQIEQRLDILTREDRSVRLTFDASYLALPLPMQQFFAALGTFGGEGFGITAVVHVTQTEAELAQTYLDELRGLSLVQMERNGRYQLHPLLKSYAQAHIASTDVWQHMVDYFVQFVHKHRNDFHLITPVLGNILSALDAARDHNWTESYLSIIAKLTFYLAGKGFYDLAQSHLESATQMANVQQYPKQLAAVLVQQGNIANKVGEYGRSTQYLQQSIPLAQETNDQDTLIAAHTIWGGNVWIIGQLDEAENIWQTALTLARKQDEKGSLIMTPEFWTKKMAVLSS